MLLSTQLVHRYLHAHTVIFATLLILLFPVNGAAAPKVDNPYEHPPKLLNYSKMTTQQLVNEGEKIIFGGLGKAKDPGAVGQGQCPICHATRKGIPGELNLAPNLFGAIQRASERLKDPRYHLGKPQDRDTVQKEAFPPRIGNTTSLSAVRCTARPDKSL